MSSKRKPNGCTSVRKVKEAMEKVGADVFTFFAQAAQAAKALDAVVVALEARQFASFLDSGLVEYHDYRLPDWAIRFAEIVHGHPCPATFFKNLPRIPQIETAA